jgi:hypothetical protein
MGMTTNYHTPISDYPPNPANAALFNTRFAELDTIASLNYANLLILQDTLILGGAALSLVNAIGGVAGGQKEVTVDATTHFVNGCYVEYQLIGGIVERNQVVTVDSPTKLTLLNDIGAAGIADNAPVAVVPLGFYHAGIGHYNVLDYGATGLGGAHNDAPGIQAAIDAAAAAGGGVVYIPAGNYALTTGLTITHVAVSLCGSGMGTVLLPALGITAITIESVSNFSLNIVSNLKIDIDNNDFGESAPFTNGIYIYKSGQLAIVENVLIVDIGQGYGIATATHTDVNNVTLQNVRMRASTTATGSGVVLACDAVLMLSCHITMNESTGTCIKFTAGCSKINIIGGECAHGDYGVYALNVTPLSLSINGMRFEHLLKNAVFIDGFNSTTGLAGNITIQDCYFTGLMDTDAGATPARVLNPAIYLRQASGVNILRNQFKPYGTETDIGQALELGGVVYGLRIQGNWHNPNGMAIHPEIIGYAGVCVNDIFLDQVSVDMISYLPGLVGVGATPALGQMHIAQASTTAAIPALYLAQSDVSEEIIEITSTAGAGNAIEAVGIKTLTTTHFIKVTINGNTRYIPAGTIA